MAKYEKKQKAGAPEWMGTYGDLVTLMLCFFIMLFAMSDVDESKSELLIQAFNPNLLEMNGGDNIIGSVDGEENAEMMEYLSDAVIYQSELRKIEESVDEFIEEEKLDDSIEVIKDNDKITLRFDSTLLFESGKANIKEKAKTYIKKVSESFPEGYQVRVEGHTDNLSINNKEFKSNWELSAFRGLNVVQYLIDEADVDSKILSVAGYGEHRPIVSNNTDEGRATNRRVDMVLYREVAE